MLKVLIVFNIGIYMAMTIHQMRIFWAVSQAKSYTKASKMLGLSSTFAISTNC